MYRKLKIVHSIVMILFLFLMPIRSLAQTDDIQSSYSDSTHVTNEHTFSYKQLIIPGTLMLYGSIEMAMAPRNRLLNYAIGHEVITHTPERFQIDDITQYVPAASVYALNLAGVKGKHNFKDRTIILGMSTLFMAASVNTIKYTAKVERPDNQAVIHFHQDIQQ